MKKLILILTATFVVNIIQGQVTNGLVAKYSFNNGNANDEVGSVNGVVHGAVLTADRFGNAGQAYDFINGEYIALPDAPALKSATMTVSLWVKIDGFNPGLNPQNFIYTIINSPTNAYFATFSMTINTLDSTYFSIAQNNPSESIYGYSAHESYPIWQHNVLSIDNDSIKMYIDGQHEWSYYKGFTTTFTSDSIYIGVSGNTTYYGNLNGSVDDIRVYNRVLSNVEVDSLFNEPNPATMSLNESQSDINVSIYPNPAQNFIYLTSQENLNTNYSILDISGRVVANGNMQGNNSMLNIEHLTNGVYFLQIGKEDPTNIKFIKN